MAFTSCSDDNDSNPTLIQPTEFKLNELTLDANALIDLEESKTIPMSWSQPVYTTFNAPVIATYSIQVSKNGNYENEYDASQDDNSAADFVTLDETFTTCKVDVSTESIDKALVRLYGWTEDSIIPNEVPVYLRVKSAVQDASFNEYGTIYSNVIKMRAVPYYIELANAPVELWYLVGAGIGSSDWDNGSSSVATGGLIPMYPIYGFEYDKVTGQGEIEYSGYFTTDVQFKLIKVPGSWDDQLNYTNVKNPGSFLSDEDGANHNIGITEAGYYHIKLNTVKTSTKEPELTIEKITDPVGVYSQITMPGEYQGWDATSNLMNGMSTSVENHDWYLMKVNYDNNTELKFVADAAANAANVNNAWAINWGKDVFPYGKGEQNGPNIPVTAGTYNVFFNDILGTYNFIPVE